jgi:hypothetical protein
MQSVVALAATPDLSDFFKCPSFSLTRRPAWIVAALLTVVLVSVVGFGIYELQRIDQAGDRISALNDKVNELPGKIGTDLRDITKMLADVVIGTTKQTQQSASRALAGSERS